MGCSLRISFQQNLHLMQFTHNEFYVVNGTLQISLHNKPAFIWPVAQSLALPGSNNCSDNKNVIKIVESKMNLAHIFFANLSVICCLM